MRCRSVLALIGSLATVTLPGCTTPSDSSDETTAFTSHKDTATVDPQSVRRQIVDCEEQHIRREYIPDGATQVSAVQPKIIEFNSQDGGFYAMVETKFGFQAPAEQDTPALHTDLLVTTYYYHGSNGTFRTEESEQHPTNGTRVQCE